MSCCINSLQKSGVAYAVETFEGFHVHVASAQHVVELSEAPDSQLSLHAHAKDVRKLRIAHQNVIFGADNLDNKILQPKYTMNGLNVHDEMNTNGLVHSRVLQILLKSNLPSLQPRLQENIRISCAAEIASGISVQDGKSSKTNEKI